MFKGVMLFLFDSGVLFQEAWEITAATSEDAFSRLKRMAQARLPLLAADTRIVQLRVTGHPPERVQWQGHGGLWAWTREALKLRHEYRSIQKQLRGVPQEIFSKGAGLTPKGVHAFRDFSRTLHECGCVIVRKGKQPELINKIEPAGVVHPRVEEGKDSDQRQIGQTIGRGEGAAILGRIEGEETVELE